MKKFLFIFFVFLSFNSLNILNLYSKQNEIKQFNYCYELNYEQSLNLNPKNFSRFEISIQIFDQRKWNKLLISEEIFKKKENKGKYYFYQNRKRVESLLLISVNDIKCKLVADIRPHGDLYDHRVGSGLPSLNVKLKKGHIFGIVEFILFRPKTRNYDNEVFATTFFRELNLLAPRSSNIVVNYKNIAEKFIFQEKINKEFLENSNLREGPIFEGDERFRNIDRLDTKNLSRHRMSNYKWSTKQDSSLIVSQFSLSILNKVNQFHKLDSSSLSELDVVDYYAVTRKINLNSFFKELAVFDSLMTALSADHGFSREDRRFYYDQIYRKFLPIYYDGMVNTLSYFNKINLKPEPLSSKIKEHFINLDMGKVTVSAVEGAAEALLLLNNLNITNLQNNLLRNGLSLDFNELNILINFLKKRLLLLKNSDKKKILNFNVDLKSRSFMNANFEGEKQGRKLLFYNNKFNGFLSCDIFGNACEKMNLSNNQIARALGQNLKINNEDYIFVGKLKNNLPIEGWYDQSFFQNEINFKEQIIDNNASIIIYGKGKFVLDENQRILLLERNDSRSRFLIYGGELKDWSIKLIDDLNEESPGSDINGLTGCVTFLDIKLSNINIFSIKSNCEDTYNFIRSTGTVKEVVIENSRSDAIDGDFSSINFKSIKINNTINDCLDFSYGSYFIENAFLEKCGDKGLSVGENSKAEVKKINVLNSTIGIASKDYSITKANSVFIKKVKGCLELYNKKQEFSGASLFIDKFFCEDFQKKYDADKTSFLEIKNN